MQSIRLKSTVKAYFRATKAAAALKKWETVLEMCEKGLQVAVMVGSRGRDGGGIDYVYGGKVQGLTMPMV